MNLIQGNLWNERGTADFLLVTTNAALRGDGALVMGRGAAKEASVLYPDLPYNLGRRLKSDSLVGRAYGIVVDSLSRCGKTRIGAFQVKYHWRDKAELSLIHLSTQRLMVVARNHPELRFALNFPGIGNGQLSRDEVLPVLESLPDNVFVYEYPTR